MQIRKVEFLKLDSWRTEKELITNTTSRILQKLHQVNQVFHGFWHMRIQDYLSTQFILVSKMMEFYHFKKKN